MENWYLPITIVPGIGLLILSTSNLMVTLSNEINSLLKDVKVKDVIINQKLKQLKTLNIVMVYFYLAVLGLVVSGFFSGLGLHKKIAFCISILGVGFMLLALILLIKYSYKAINIRQDQFKDLLK